MRHLTVKRNKSFVGCIAKLKVYIEDADFGTTEISGVRCRKLGDLKNGEEKTFEIFEGEAKIFVIADGVSKNFCNDFYALPEGTEDVSLSGRCRYNPANGNAFRFDNNDNPEAIANRKKGTKKGIIVLIAAFVAGIIIGTISGLSSGCNPDKKDFSVDGMTITLTEEFKEMDEAAGEYNAAYGTDDVGVLVIKEEFTLAEDFGDYTLDEYVDLVLYANNKSGITVKKEDGLTYFEYEEKSDVNQLVYTYRIYVYKSNDAFWMLQFYSLKGDFDEYSDSFKTWASSVQFN